MRAVSRWAVPKVLKGAWRTVRSMVSSTRRAAWSPPWASMSLGRISICVASAVVITPT